MNLLRVTPLLLGLSGALLPPSALRPSHRNLTTCTEQQSVTNSGGVTPKTAPGPFDGSVTGDVYVNRFFGFSLRLPHGWTVLSTDATKAMFQRNEEEMANASPELKGKVTTREHGAYPLLQVIEGAPGDLEYDRRHIAILASRVPPSGLSSEAFAKALAAAIQKRKLPLNLVAGPSRVEIQGESLYRLDIVEDARGGTYRGAIFTTLKNGFALQFMLVSRDADGLSELEETIKSLSYR